MVQEENAPETQKSEISAPVGANVSAQSDGGSTSNSASGASDSRKPPQPSAPQTAQIDALAQRLDEKSNDMRLLGLAATELRDSVEAFQNSQDYPYFVEKLVPIILELLKTTPVSFNSGTPEQVSWLLLNIWQIKCILTRNLDYVCLTHSYAYRPTKRSNLWPVIFLTL